MSKFDYNRAPGNGKIREYIWVPIADTIWFDEVVRATLLGWDEAWVAVCESEYWVGRGKKKKTLTAYLTPGKGVRSRVMLYLGPWKEWC